MHLGVLGTLLGASGSHIDPPELHLGLPGSIFDLYGCKFNDLWTLLIISVS